jgi:hypothetical protein
MKLTEEIKKAIAEEVATCAVLEPGPLCKLHSNVSCDECPYTTMLGASCGYFWTEIPNDDGYKLLVAYLLADVCGVEVK